jgi:hypothetical protein
MARRADGGGGKNVSPMCSGKSSSPRAARPSIRAWSSAKTRRPNPLRSNRELSHVQPSRAHRTLAGLS